VGRDRSEHEAHRWNRGARRAAPFDAVSEALDEYSESGNRLPEFRERVRALVESQWGEPVVVLYLEEVKPTYHVLGRRRDGTIRGERLGRRFFWNILRGAINGLVNVFLLFAAGGMSDVFERSSRVTGPENAQALGLVDAARSAKCVWLVYSAKLEATGPSGAPMHVAIVDSGNDYKYTDPADCPPPTFLWQAAKPHAPVIRRLGQRFVWPDGSRLEHFISDEERRLLKQHLWD
jgi:hypothetical protein